MTNNYTWNRLWTFRGQRGHVGYQGLRFFVVSTVALAANLVVLHLLVQAGLGKVLAQAIAIVLVTPLNFVGNKLWSFRATSCALVAALILAAPARCGREPRRPQPVYDDQGRLVETPFAPPAGERAADRGGGDGDPLPRAEGPALARPLPAEPADRRRLPAGERGLGGEGLVGARPGRSCSARSTTEPAP